MSPIPCFCREVCSWADEHAFRVIYPFSRRVCMALIRLPQAGWLQASKQFIAHCSVTDGWLAGWLARASGRHAWCLHSTPGGLVGMRLSCNLVNMYTKACKRLSYTYIVANNKKQLVSSYVCNCSSLWPQLGCQFAKKWQCATDYFSRLFISSCRHICLHYLAVL